MQCNLFCDVLKTGSIQCLFVCITVTKKAELGKLPKPKVSWKLFVAYEKIFLYYYYSDSVYQFDLCHTQMVIILTAIYLSTVDSC